MVWEWAPTWHTRIHEALRKNLISALRSPHGQHGIKRNRQTWWDLCQHGLRVQRRVHPGLALVHTPHMVWGLLHEWVWSWLPPDLTKGYYISGFRGTVWSTPSGKDNPQDWCTYHTMDLGHLAAQVRTPLLKSQIERIFLKIFIIKSHMDFRWGKVRLLVQGRKKAVNDHFQIYITHASLNLAISKDPPWHIVFSSTDLTLQQEISKTAHQF